MVLNICSQPLSTCLFSSCAGNGNGNGNGIGCTRVNSPFDVRVCTQMEVGAAQLSAAQLNCPPWFIALFMRSVCLWTLVVRLESHVWHSQLPN